MNYLKLVSIGAIAAYSIYGCTGPQGPAGPQGINGINGINGANSFANVSIKLDSIAKTGWKQIGSPNAAAYCDTIADAGIADTNYNVVEIYYSIVSRSGPWTVLPASDIYYSAPNDTLDQLGFTWSLGKVIVKYKILLPGYTVPPKGTIYLDIAAIPAAFIKKHPTINWKNARTVMSLPEVEAVMEK